MNLGYCCLLFGNFNYILIFIGSGIFANAVSCITREQAVVVGSGPAILGVLCAWLVWIIYRWSVILFVSLVPLVLCECFNWIAVHDISRL